MLTWLLWACAAEVQTGPTQASDTAIPADTAAPAPLDWQGCTSAYEIGTLDGLDDPLVSIPTVVGDLGYFSAFGQDGRNRIVRATVQDGTFVDPEVAFEGPDPIRVPAGPALLHHDDGSWSMFLVGDDEDGAGIWRCTGTDGLAWQDCAIVLPAGSGSPYDDSVAQLPHVLATDGGYRLWYTGMDAAGDRRILTATSDDAWTWSTPELALDLGSEGTYDDTSLYSPFVWQDAGGYRMLYSGRAEHEGYLVKRLIEAWSDDGVNWRRFVMTVDLGCAGDADAWRVDAPWVVPEGDGWRLYYDGFNDPLTAEGQRVLLTATAAAER